MGILYAAGSSLESVLQEQWREVFYCDALDDSLLMIRAQKRTSERSGNTRQNDRIVTNGSLLFVADGQAVIVLSQGKVIDVCTDPGAHRFEDKDRPGGVAGFFRSVGERIAFGGGDVQPVTHAVYYVNTRECMGNRFETPAPVPLALGDANIGLSIDASVQCGGTYSFRIVDPAVFYRAVTGNFPGTYERKRIVSQLETLLLTALQTGLGEQVQVGLRLSLLPAMAMLLSEAIRQKWSELTESKYGIQIVSLAIDSMHVLDAAKIAELQAHAVLQDPNAAKAHLAGATADAMQTAAKQ